MRHGYHRPAYTRLLWGAGIALALAAALCFAGRATVSAIQERERAAVLAEGDTLFRLALAHGDSLRRVVDSLRILAVRRDTIVLHTIERARVEAVSQIPSASDTVALVTAVRSCRATLDTLASDCDAFRVAATAALATADTLHRADSTALAGLSQQLAAVRRTDSTTIATLSRRPRWRTLVGAVVGTAALTTLLR